MIRWISQPNRLSKEQDRVLRKEDQQGYVFGVSAATLVEIALLSQAMGSRKVPLDEIFPLLENQERFQIIPVDFDVAREIAALGDFLKDPSDRTIVATARVHDLRLVTSDQRIIASKLAPVVE